MTQYDGETAEEYASRLSKRVAELEAARWAYASEFPRVDGEPDVGSIHENIRKSLDRVAELEGLLESALPAVVRAGQYDIGDRIEIALAATPAPTNRKGDGMSEWISVKDRMPELEEHVDIWANGFRCCEVQRGWDPTGDGGWFWCDVDGNIMEELVDDEGFQSGVTHWMPLPAPPTKSEPESEL